jgi:hypothetical protein
MVKTLLRFLFYSLPLIAFLANSSEPRAEVAGSRGALHFGLPVKVIIYKSHRTLLPGLSGISPNTLHLQIGRPEAQELMAFIRTKALEHGVNPDLALWIARHESGFNPRAQGDGDASRGLWQISKIYHPEVSDGAAFGVASSTEWSLERIRSGKANEWSTYRFCKTLYGDCPF